MWCIVSSSTCSSRQPQQPAADQRAARQVERPRCFFASALAAASSCRVIRVSRAGPDPPAQTRLRWRSRCTGCSASTLEARAQRLVPRHDAIQRCAAAPRSSRPQPQRRRECGRPRCRRPAAPGTTAAAARTTAAALRDAARRRSAQRCCLRPRGAPAAQAGSAPGMANSSSSGTSQPRPSRTREISRTASSEWPPSSKKLSWRPTRSTLSSSPRCCASVCSISPCGRLVARARDSAAASGAGSALRSSLPFGVSGKRVQHARTPPAPCTPADAPAGCARSCVQSHRCSARRHIRHQPLVARPSSRASTTASRTAGVLRQPRLDLAQLDPEAADLHLGSLRPRNSMRAVRHASAPGRRSGTAAAARAERIGDEALRRQLAAGSGSRAPRRAADVQLAHHAHGDRLAMRVQHVDPRVAIGRPIGMARHRAASRASAGVKSTSTVASVGP